MSSIMILPSCDDDDCDDRLLPGPLSRSGVGGWDVLKIFLFMIVLFVTCFCHILVFITGWGVC